MMRCAFLKEISKAVKNQSKINKGQVPMDLEDGEIIVENISTLIMVGTEIDILGTLQVNDVLISDEYAP